MNEKARTMAKVLATGALLIGAAVLCVSRMGSVLAIGEEGLQVWFYDQSEQELYKAEKDTIPPEEGVGGIKGDGVRAVVVACQGECADPERRQIAYLERYTQELKGLLEDVRAARAQGRAPARPIPSGDSGYFDKNTLVRRLEEGTWYDMTTPEARRIAAEWRDARACDGSPLMFCAP